MRLIIALLAISACAMAQDGIAVNQSDGPPGRAFTKLYFYDGSGNIEYICTAVAAQQGWTVTPTQIVDSSNTSTVTTSADHGLQVGNLVTISGATIDADLNGTYVIQTVPSTTTFTVTTASVTDATYNENTLRVSGFSARTTEPIWAIQKFLYSSGKLSASQWSVGSSGMINVCANRATTTGSTKISFQ